MKYKYIKVIIISLLIQSLLLNSVLGITINPEIDSCNNQLKINRIGIEPQYMKTSTSTSDITKFKISKSNKTNYCFYGMHPSLGRTEDGLILSAYYDNDVENIIWTFSSDDGENFDTGLYWEGGGDYPTVKLWDAETFFGTFVTNYEDGYGGVTYIFDASDRRNCLLGLIMYEIATMDYATTSHDEPVTNGLEPTAQDDIITLM